MSDRPFADQERFARKLLQQGLGHRPGRKVMLRYLFLQIFFSRASPRDGTEKEFPAGLGSFCRARPEGRL